LLIKHRDDWSGELDITEFAPKSVKSAGDFEDILAEDTPAVWISHRPARPAQGGDAGAMLETIIERAARLKAARPKEAKRPARGSRDARTRRGSSQARAPRAKKPRAG
jgi:hypothetical protein